MEDKADKARMVETKGKEIEKRESTKRKEEEI